MSPSARSLLFVFFFNDTATTEIYTLSLHDALPIYVKLAVVTIDTDTTVHTLYGQQMGGRKSYRVRSKSGPPKRPQDRLHRVRGFSVDGCCMNRRQFFLNLSSAPLLAQTATPSAPELEWVDAKKLTVEGLGFKDVKSPNDRLPERAEGVVPPAVWNLSRDSAGALVRFTAATTEIHARWTGTNKNLAGANITAIASSGLDLYAKTDAGKWRWLGVGQPKFPDTTASLVNGIRSEERRVGK